MWQAGLAACVIGAVAAGRLAYSRRDAPVLADLKIRPLTSQAGWENAPALSPDGGSIAFTWADKLDGVRNLYLKRLPDDDPVKLTDYSSGLVGYLAWSPDGKRIAFKYSPDQSKAPDPAALAQNTMLAHVYAWTPFNANCSADTNLLEDTPGYANNNYAGYQSVKSKFDDLNYSSDFNPYVKLIHDPQYLNAKYVYAYSVDDAVRNMQTSGEGMIIAVGGAAGLPNVNPATAPVHIPFGYAATDKVRFVKYGVCTDTPNQDVNPHFTSFDLSATQISDCTLSFVDNQSPAKLYYFKIKTQPPYPSRPPDGEPIPDVNKTMIDCGGNTPFITQTWCANIYGYTQGGIGAHSKEDDYISVSAPAQPATEIPSGLIEAGKLYISANRVTPNDSVVLSITLTARGADTEVVAVNFYEGDLRSGGRLVAAEQIPSIASHSQRVVQTGYRTNTCGVHQLFAVVNEGKPTEQVRRAQPVRVDCNGAR